MEDEEIIKLYFSRNEQAIQETKLKFGKKLEGLSFKITKSIEDTEECVNDTYLTAWNNIPPQRPTYLFAYMAKICRNLCFGKLDYEKAKKRNSIIVELSEEILQTIPCSMSEMQIEEILLIEILEKYLETLSKESRLFFMSRYWFAETVKEIAVKYGVSEGKVKMTLLRTRKKLKAHLESEGIDL